MGKITLTVEGSSVGTVATGGGIVIEKTVSEADSSRLVAHYAERYGVAIAAPSDVAVVLQRWFDVIVEQCTAEVLEGGQRKAARAAAAAVSPIEIT